jgi:hypothetical protein
MSQQKAIKCCPDQLLCHKTERVSDAVWSLYLSICELIHKSIQEGRLEFRIQLYQLMLLLSINYITAGNMPISVSSILCYYYCALSYIPYFNQQNALIKAQ